MSNTPTEEEFALHLEKEIKLNNNFIEDINREIASCDPRRYAGCQGLVAGESFEDYRNECLKRRDELQESLNFHVKIGGDLQDRLARVRKYISEQN